MESQEVRKKRIDYLNNALGKLLSVAELPTHPRDIIGKTFCYCRDGSSEAIYGLVTGIRFGLVPDRFLLLTNLQEENKPSFFLFVCDDKTFYYYHCFKNGVSFYREHGWLVLL